ncbi:hypothetical protein [Rhodococcus yananensis]|uniref:hypothetical protein n=1 Tax=Rhodococcus yananensis TaxID=2879464 RepID=UPI001CF828A9|nr:hypothetical protein [Rhodococcus yananensis]
MTRHLTAFDRDPAPDPSGAELFRTVLDMAQAAKAGNSSGWLAARYRGASLDDLAYLSTAMLGVLIENEAVRRGVHPADAWRDLGRRGLDDFG